ncbi:magnesium/cobalt transporter CorA [Gangjinia marincola]|uniref:Magnesium transport protein CorA n=1 Tax=Gangjinia marincola TaxID=578463 RepID=A0ABP3XRR4_9FLAO
MIPGTAVYVGNKEQHNLHIEVFDYDKERYEERILEHVDEAFSFEDEQTITWINLNGLNYVQDIERLGKHYDLHPLTIEDIANTSQRPKIEEFEDYTYLVLKMLYYNEQNELVIEHISFVLGSNYVISFQEADGDVFDEVRNRIRNLKGRVRNSGADYLQYVLMDAIVDHYFTLLEVMSDNIESLEDALFESSENEGLAQEIQELKREVLRVRRAVVPLREVISRISKSDSDLFTEKTNIFINDLYDHIIQVSESIDLYREMTWGLMDMYMTTISNKMNEVMKVLTIISTIFIPLSFFAGLYGMNFEHMPELDYRYGYFILLGIMGLAVIGMLYYFKRKKWL